MSTAGVAQQYVISTYAGGVSLGLTPAVALNVAIGSPQGIASDAAGNLYFTGLNCVFKMDRNGVLTRVAGSGIPGYSGDGGQAISAQLDSPKALALDSKNNLYIADTSNYRVRKVDPGGIITTVAGNGPSWYNNGAGDGGPATSAPLFFPWQLAVDSAGNLHIGEWNTPRVRKVSADGIISTVTGNGIVGYSGDGGPATNAAMGAPWGLAFDSAGNLYISDDIPGDDYSPQAVRVRKVSPDGIITTVAGTGNLYIADTFNYRVRKVSTNGTITTVAGNGLPGYSGDGGSATGAQLIYPAGVKVDSAGNLYIGDGAAVRMVSVAGIITTVAGNGTSGYSGDGGPATSAQTGAWGLAFDSAGNLYVADTWNNAIRLLKPVSSAVR